MFNSTQLRFLLVALLLGLSARGLQAQSDSFPSPLNLVEHMFGALNVTHIPHGLLYPAALPLEAAHEYNGRRLPHDGRRLTPKRFGNLLFTLQSAQRDTSRPALFNT